MIFDNLTEKEEIHLRTKDLRNEDLDVVTKVLQKSDVLKKIDLWNNWIALVDGKFTDALANNHTLRILDLTCNDISAEGTKRLATALKANQTLQVISLYINQIGNEGPKAWPMR